MSNINWKEGVEAVTDGTCSEPPSSHLVGSGILARRRADGCLVLEINAICVEDVDDGRILWRKATCNEAQAVDLARWMRDTYLRGGS